MHNIVNNYINAFDIVTMFNKKSFLGIPYKLHQTKAFLSLNYQMMSRWKSVVYQLTPTYPEQGYLRTSGKNILIHGKETHLQLKRDNPGIKISLVMIGTSLNNALLKIPDEALCWNLKLECLSFAAAQLSFK